MSGGFKFMTAEDYMDFGCPNCGEALEGDGYTLPYHCINASEERWWYSEPDSGPWLCEGHE